MVLPPAPFLRIILLRSLLVWAGIRGFLYLRAGAIVPTPGAAAFTILLVAFLTVLDGRRRNEHLFLANLAVSRWTLIALGAVIPLGAELLTHFLT